MSPVWRGWAARDRGRAPRKGRKAMARTRRVKRDGDAHYHVMSRTNDRRFLFAEVSFRKEIVGLLLRAAEFSGVGLDAYAVMSDHFHVVCGVSRPEGPVPEDEVLRRIAVLRGARFAEREKARWDELRGGGRAEAAEAAVGRWRRRMNDVSEFAKTFKELVNVACKRRLKERGKDYCGSIWSGRFKSTLIEDGRYLATCVRYVELNPVRAGMVRRAKDYACSSAHGAGPSERPAGPVPEVRLLRRIAQIGGGVIFGSAEFVAAGIEGYGGCWRGKPRARPVEGDCWSSHGHRLGLAAGGSAEN